MVYAIKPARSEGERGRAGGRAGGRPGYVTLACVSVLSLDCLSTRSTSGRVSLLVQVKGRAERGRWRCWAPVHVLVQCLHDLDQLAALVVDAQTRRKPQCRQGPDDASNQVAEETTPARKEPITCPIWMPCLTLEADVIKRRRVDLLPLISYDLCR